MHQKSSLLIIKSFFSTFLFWILTSSWIGRVLFVPYSWWPQMTVKISNIFIIMTRIHLVTSIPLLVVTRKYANYNSDLFFSNCEPSNGEKNVNIWVRNNQPCVSQELAKIWDEKFYAYLVRRWKGNEELWFETL